MTTYDFYVNGILTDTMEASSLECAEAMFAIIWLQQYTPRSSAVVAR